jgi:hypothetical protein
VKKKRPKPATMTKRAQPPDVAVVADVAVAEAAAGQHLKRLSITVKRVMGFGSTPPSLTIPSTQNTGRGIVPSQ